MISVWIFIEAYQRFESPPDVIAGPMLAVAVAGLFVNVGAAAILQARSGDSLNVSAAYRHVLADLAGSAGVIVAALIILTTGWEYADPLVSALIGVLILASSVSIIRDAGAVLLEASPRGLDVEEIGTAMAREPGVREVHDLHVWEITSGFPALAAHVLVDEEADCHEARRSLERLLVERFDLTHTTLQVDHYHPELLQIENAHPRGAEPLSPDADQGRPAEKLTE